MSYGVRPTVSIPRTVAGGATAATLAFALLTASCTGAVSPSTTVSAPPQASSTVPVIVDAMAELERIGRPIKASVIVDDLPAGVHAAADGGITVSREWLDEMIVNVDVMAGVLSHEQWHLDEGPHTCEDGRRDRRGIPGAWQYHAETLRLLGAFETANVVASAVGNYCD